MNLSFEYFPPRTADQALVLEATHEKLARLNPEYVSVTFGAGGSTTDATRRTVLKFHDPEGIPAVPHLSCNVSDRDTADRLLDEYAAAGIRRLVVLRGDRPSGTGGGGPFNYAEELVRHIRDRGGDFRIEVACYPECHPEADSPARDLKFFRRKVEAGADGAITQYFFNPDCYFRFLDECRAAGIDIPITPGIMPITNYRQLARFSAMCGAEIPVWIRRRLEAYGDDLASIREFGLEVVTGLCRRLLDGGAPGLHIYTLNRAKATMALWRNLDLAGP